MKKINHVLLIDDDVIINMINNRVIEISEQVTKITAVSSAEEALTLLNNLIRIDQTEFPAFIFLDINMPEMDGWEFLQVFAEFSKEILLMSKVIVLTSSIDASDLKKAKNNALIFDFISKPLSLEIFNHVVDPNHQRFSINKESLMPIY